jgi:hypothetical protein
MSPKPQTFYEDGLGWGPLMAMADIAFYQLPRLVFVLFEKTPLEAGAARKIDGAFSGVAIAINELSRAEVDLRLNEAAAAGGDPQAGRGDPVGRLLRLLLRPAWHTSEVAHNPFCSVHADGSTTLHLPVPESTTTPS